jgi:cytochrome c-type biogenesis protein CcmH
MRRSVVLATLAVILLPALAPAAQQATLVDLEDEVMCPICGTLLELSNAPQAERQRALINRLIAAGKTKAEIKDALVAQYGREVLALPRGSGFNLSAYLVPVIGFVVAALALAIGITRWRRAAGRRPKQPPSSGTEPDDEDARRLAADLAKYDL